MKSGQDTRFYYHYFGFSADSAQSYFLIVEGNSISKHQLIVILVP